MEEPKKKSSVSKNDDGTMQNNEMTPVLKVLLNPYLLRNIFQYLPDGRNLASAAMVCRSWLEAANNENKRRGPCYIVETYSYTNIPIDPNLDGRILQIIGYDNFDMLLHDDSSGLQLRLPRPHRTSNFIKDIRNIRIKPLVCLFFVDEDAVDSDMELECIVNLLPKDCETIKLYNYGIIMEREFKDRRPDYEPEEKMLCAFLPQIPNVRVKSFKLPENCIISETAEYQEIISTIVNNKTSSLNHETCFMLFYNQEYTTADRWASAILKSKKNKVVSVWGGGVTDLWRKGQTKIKPSERYKSQCIAVLITGPIQTWSIILEKECMTRKQTSERLKLFKEKVKLKKHSIGFVFANSFRYDEFKDCSENEFEEGAEIDERSFIKNAEISIFKDLFRTVPLVGCLSEYGTFGTNTVIDEIKKEKDNKEKQDCKKSKSCYNEGSTAFLILTYD